MNVAIILLLLFSAQHCAFAGTRQPHIIFILADDLGWNDVGFHGSCEIPTPNIDALAYSGLILNNYYVTYLCTPSRSALMTGKHPIHTGMQNLVLLPAEPRGLPLGETLLPQYLKNLGYASHMVGKWHLGSYKKEYTPTYRGFDSHLGFWNYHHDYSDHTLMFLNQWGLDMRRNMDVAYDLHGQYSTDVFSNEAVKIINNHNKTKPLFLYVAHAAVHSANPYNPLPSPDDYVARFTHIDDYNRRRFAGVLTKLDESVGKVIQALSVNNMLNDSIIIFSTDNGGPANGFNDNAASNWPLRGVKNTLFEGGVRGTALVWSPLITERRRVALQMMHISDWLPTLYSAAGGDSKNLGEIDGYNLWPSLSNNTQSPRGEVLHNINNGNSAITVGKWKLLNGSTLNGTWDSWYGPSGRYSYYNVSNVLTSPAGKALNEVNLAANETTIKTLRKLAEVTCSQEATLQELTPCNPLEAECLFNINNDPCERNNLALKYPNVLARLKARLGAWGATAVRPGNKLFDPRGFPQYWNYTWTNFGDYLL